MKLVLACCVAAAILLATSAALGARGYTDTADDTNAAPDITLLDIAEATPGVLTIRVSERWDPRAEDWVPDDLPTRARVRTAGTSSPSTCT